MKSRFDTVTDSGDISLEDLQGPKIDRRTTVKLLSGAGVVGLAGCAGSDTSADTSASDASATGSGASSIGGSITAGWYASGLDDLDPHYVTSGERFQLVANITSGLTKVTPEVEMHGDLATDWTVENNGARIVYELRDDVRFHNGEEFTAADVAFSVERSITEEAPNSDLLSPLKPIDDGGISVIDDYTVAIEFEQPYIPGLIYFSREGRAANVINQTALEEMGREDFKRAPVGTGPFKVASHDVGEKIELEAFDEYYDTDENGTQLPYLDGVTIRAVPEAGTIVNALRSGDLDFINEVPLENAPRLEQSSDVVVHKRPDLNYYNLSMNSDVEPFTTKTARLGFAKLIDSERLVQEGFFGNANPEPTLYSPAHEWIYRDWEDKPQDQAYDPDEGQRLLEEAGVADASVTLLADGRTKRLMEIIQRQLSNAGLDVSIEQVSTSVYWDRVPDADAVITWSSGDYDPDTGIYRSFHSEGIFNDAGYDNERVDELLEAQRETTDRDERRAQLQEVEDRVIKDAPTAFFGHRQDVVGHSSHVSGFVHIPFQRRLEYLSTSE